MPCSAQYYPSREELNRLKFRIFNTILFGLFGMKVCRKTGKEARNSRINFLTKSGLKSDIIVDDNLLSNPVESFLQLS